MEVHHHTHSSPRGTHSSHQKWNHYLWEFLMLFLAVFAVFLAENQREHIVEHRRAKIYASNLYDELEKDTIQLGRLIRWSRQINQTLDSFCKLGTKGLVSTANGMLYYYSRHIGAI